MTATLEQRVLDYCFRYQLCQDSSVLVALSGGGDSVALLHILHSLSKPLGINITAAHLHHGLRGEESDADELFCKEVCAALGIPLIVDHVPEGSFPSSRSPETLARTLRRSFLMHTAALHSIYRIATGHNADDQAETVLMRLIRGTGPSGLAAMRPLTDSLWIRPLLAITRAELRSWLVEHQISYREDASNTDRSIIRNRIRLELLPFLRKHFNPAVTRSLTRLADIAREEENYLDGVIAKALAACRIHSDRYKILLDRPRFLAYHTMVQRRLVRQVLSHLEGNGRDTDSDEVDIILSTLETPRSHTTVTGKTNVSTCGQLLVFSAGLSSYGPMILTVPGITELPCSAGIIRADFSATGIDTNGNSLEVTIPRAHIDRYGPLSVGSINPGERFHPAGTHSAVNIRDLLSKAGVPAPLRATMPIVRAGAVPVWLPGIAVAAETTFASVNAKSVPVLHLTMTNGLCWKILVPRTVCPTEA